MILISNDFLHKRKIDSYNVLLSISTNIPQDWFCAPGTLILFEIFYCSSVNNIFFQNHTNEEPSHVNKYDNHTLKG